MNALGISPVFRILCRSVLITFLLSWLDLGAAWAQPSPAPVLIKIIDAKGVTVLGELTAENEESVELIELKSGKKRTFPKSALNDFRKGISEKEAADTIGLAEFLVWRIRKVIPGGALVGKVAHIDSPAIFVNLGLESGIGKEQELIVYRGDTEIKDPDTGAVLNRQRKRIARLAVIEAMEKLSKCKLVGDLDVELKVGDTVESASQSKPIAVLPLVDLNGCVRAGGKKLGEDLTTGLVQGGISIVERTLLAKVLVELGLQNTKVFDAGSAQKIGRQLGAYAILTGTLTPSGNKSDANIRLIKVETGEILFASPLNGPSLGGIIACGSETIIVTPENGDPSNPLPLDSIHSREPNVANRGIAVAPGWQSLFNGSDLTGWIQRNPRSTALWTVQDGALVGSGTGWRERNDIYSKQSFWNFTFRCDFMISRGGNSGIYLRGRHEIQIIDDYNARKLTPQSNGAIWDIAAPSQFASRPADQWQTIEATMVGNKVTIVLNGKTIHRAVECKQAVRQEFSLDTHLNAPGSILLQGHTGVVRFRNIQIREIK